VTFEEFLLSLDELLELEPGTLKGPEELASLENWDSLSVVSFLGMAKARADKTVSPKAIAACKNVDDLFALLTAEKSSD
jgi:acyl carrier protein